MGLLILLAIYAICSLVWILGFYWRDEKKPWDYPL